MFEVLIAFALILQNDEYKADNYANPVMMNSIQQVALSLELLDKREFRYIMAKPEDFASDLKLIQARYKKLSSAPPLSDSERLIDRTIINDMMSFNRLLKQHIELRRSMETRRYWYYEEVLQDIERLYTIWDKVRDAKCEYYYVTVRREALKDLRDLIGCQNYYSGQLPPCVPVWYFESID
jgi:hypothetical protein